MRLGFRLLVATVVTAPFVTLIVILTSSAIAVVDEDGALAFAAAGFRLITLACAAAMPLAGLWLVSTPDPRPFAARKRRAARVLRAVVLTIAAWLALVAIESFRYLPVELSLWFLALFSPIGAAGFVVLTAFALLAARLVERGGDSQTASFIRVMLRVLIASALVTTALGLCVVFISDNFLVLGIPAGFAALLSAATLALAGPFFGLDAVRRAIKIIQKASARRAKRESSIHDRS